MKLGHVHLKVRNIERSEAFYKKLLLADVTESIRGQYTFLSFGEMHHDIALQEIGEEALKPPRRSIGLYHVAFELAGESEFKEVIDRIVDIGGQYQLIDHGISRAVYTSDPDGNGLEFYIDRRNLQGGRQRWEGKSVLLDRDTLQ